MLHFIIELWNLGFRVFKLWGLGLRVQPPQDSGVVTGWRCNLWKPPRAGLEQIQYGLKILDVLSRTLYRLVETPKPYKPLNPKPLNPHP